ncbi:MAG: lasso peptide biosynthesis B2 protein [Candidatus Sumerlaeota bacterium]|nr:lasso peptide biosynthesis B2 protein [Candidatus Sumerlaeota bacterium]
MQTGAWMRLITLRLLPFRWIQRHLKDGLLFLATWLLLWLVRVALWLLPFRWIRWVLASRPTGVAASPPDRARLVRIVQRIEAAGRLVPGGRNCLARALTLKAILNLAGFSCDVRFGVAHDPRGRLAAHAWVESGGIVLIGDTGDLSGFALLKANRNTPWVPLFNGKDLTGWTVKCKPEDKDKGFFRVEDGCIVADSMGLKDHDYVWLVSDRELGDFEIRLKFQCFRDSPGNSGIQIRSRYDDDAFWMDGPQIDIHPPGPSRIGLIYDETREVRKWLCPDLPKGKMVDGSQPNPKMIFRYSDEGDGWNDLQIRAEKLTVTTALNGVSVADFDGEGILNDAARKSHNVGEKGSGALQIHTKDDLRIRFKDIEVREVP